MESKDVTKAVKGVINELFGETPSIGDKKRVEYRLNDGSRDVSLLITVDGSSYVKVLSDGTCVYSPFYKKILEDIHRENMFLFRCHSLGKLKTKPRGKSGAELYEEAMNSLKKAKEERTLKIKELEDKLKNTPETQEEKIKQIEDSLKNWSEELDSKIKVLESDLRVLEISKDVKEVSETAKKEIATIYVDNCLGRRRELKNKEVVKGLDVEDEAINILSIVDGYTYIKNEVRLIDDELRLTGVFDLRRKHEDGTIEILDVKNRYDAISFFSQDDEVQKKHESDQLDGYLLLDEEADIATIVNVLCNNTDDAITREVYLASLRENEGELSKAKQIEIIKEHVFDDMNFRRIVRLIVGEFESDSEAVDVFDSFREIPMEMRVKKVSRERDEKSLAETREALINSFEFAKSKYNVK